MKGDVNFHLTSFYCENGRQHGGNVLPLLLLAQSTARAAQSRTWWGHLTCRQLANSSRRTSTSCGPVTHIW